MKIESVVVWWWSSAVGLSIVTGKLEVSYWSDLTLADADSAAACKKVKPSINFTLNSASPLLP